MVTNLIPVSSWTYNLYRVEFYTADPEAGGRLLKTDYCAAAFENHLIADCNERAPGGCNWFVWEIEKDNVGHPRVVGSLYGLPVYETGWKHGHRLKGIL